MYRQARENHNPSFSSSLLDEIYRSIDERPEQEQIGYSKQSSYSGYSSFSGTNGYFRNDISAGCDVDRKVSSNGRDHCLIEKWMVQDVRSGVDFKRSSQRRGNSSSSSSDSSSGGGFSSSEAESVYCVPSRPKPIRTGTNRHDEYSTRAKPNPKLKLKPKQVNVCDQRYQFDDLQVKQKHEGKFVTTKSRAMKIYGDLKKVKQPISPGGRLAAFLNSIFTTGNTKNTKLSSSNGGMYEGDDGGRNTHTHIDRQSKSAGVSTCSSASSFSRSCLSKTPSSRGKLSNSKKRSVRFYPVSVIVGDDCQPCGEKTLYGEEYHESNLHALKFVKNPIHDEFILHSNEKSRRIEEAARNLLRNYQKKVECEFELITNNTKVENEIDLNYEDDDDGVGSHTSSDLFELENFSAIGMEDYGDELPVYETTHLDTSLAIGNGFR